MIPGAADVLSIFLLNVFEVEFLVFSVSSITFYSLSFFYFSFDFM